MSKKIALKNVQKLRKIVPKFVEDIHGAYYLLFQSRYQNFPRGDLKAQLKEAALSGIDSLERLVDREWPIESYFSVSSGGITVRLEKNKIDNKIYYDASLLLEYYTHVE